MTATIDPVQTLITTDRNDAVLVVWLGGCDVPHAYWPTDDEAACLAAVKEWVRREESIFTAQDTDDGPETLDERVERYMSAISIDVAFASRDQAATRQLADDYKAGRLPSYADDPTRQR